MNLQFLRLYKQPIMFQISAYSNCLATLLFFSLQLRVWKIQEDIRTATDHRVDKVMETVLHGLQKQTVYVLRILAYNAGGDGALSESVYFTVLGKIISNVRKRTI